MDLEGGTAIATNHPLKPTTFPLLLGRLYQKRATGLLQLDRDDVKKAVYFKRGYPIFARSNLVRESLGQMLVRQELISQQQCEEGLALSRQKKCYLGTALIELGRISPRQLHEVLKSQVMEKLLEIFSWTRGSYSFVTARDFRAGVTSIEMSPAGLMCEGLRRYSSPAQVDALLLRHGNPYLKLSETPELLFQDLHLCEKDRNLLRQCNGCRNLEQLCALHPLSRRDIRALVAALLCAGVLEPLCDQASQSCTPFELPESPEEKLQRESFLKEYEQMIHLDHFRLFGLEKSCSREEVRQAYFRLAKKYHPDRFSQKHRSEQLLDKITELFQHISKAYEVLMDPARRTAYSQSLGQEKKMASAQAQALVLAELAYRKGEFLLRKREYSLALPHLRSAVSQGPGEAEYLAQYAWALYKANPGNPGCAFEAHEKLLKAKEMDPGQDSTHLYLGFMYKDENRSPQAQREFELAIQCNPDCTEALRELRLLDRRRQEAPAKKGLLDRILKR